MAGLRILVVDDQPTVRIAVNQLLRDELPDVVIGEAGDGNSAVERARQQRWDAVVLDVSMPGKGGLDVLPALRALRPCPAVIMFSMEASARVVAESLRRGALGYVLKEHGPDQLVPALRSVLLGERYVSPGLEQGMPAVVAPQTATAWPRPDRQALSPAENARQLTLAAQASRAESARLVETAQSAMLSSQQLCAAAALAKASAVRRLTQRSGATA